MAGYRQTLTDKHNYTKKYTNIMNLSPVENSVVNFSKWALYQLMSCCLTSSTQNANKDIPTEDSGSDLIIKWMLNCFSL